MAQRFLRATGNWSGPVWAATSGGAAGSASTPTASDDVIINANFTVTINTNVSCNSIAHLAGTITNTSYNVTTKSLYSYTSTARTINLGSGTWTINPDEFGSAVEFEGSNLTLNAGSSLIIINVAAVDVSVGAARFTTLNKIFNDVQINLGTGTTPITLNISGSPTFRSLVIQSKNSAAHTVNFDNSATITTDKFAAIGSSESTFLSLYVNGGTATIEFTTNGTSYGQYVIPSNFNVGEGFTKAYIGSELEPFISPFSGWVAEYPPKISTLVDPLTTTPTSNPNWTVTGTINKRTDGLGGGGYSGTTGAAMTSTDTFDIIGSSLVFERPIVDPTGSSGFGVGGTLDFILKNMALWSATLLSGGTVSEREHTSRYDVAGGGITAFTYPITTPKFIRIEVALNGYFQMSYSDNGIAWTMVNNGYLNATEILLLRSTRIKGTWAGVSHIGSIGMLPAAPPSPRGNWLPFFT